MNAALGAVQSASVYVVKQPRTWSLSRTGLVVASRTHAPSLLPPPNTIMFFETKSGFPTANLSGKKDAPEYFETIFVKI